MPRAECLGCLSPLSLPTLLLRSGFLLTARRGEWSALVAARVTYWKDDH